MFIYLLLGQDPTFYGTKTRFYWDTRYVDRYPAEEHFAVTADGYIIAMHRIPHGQNAGKMTAKLNSKVSSSVGSLSFQQAPQKKTSAPFKGLKSIWFCFAISNYEVLYATEERFLGHPTFYHTYHNKKRLWECFIVSRILLSRQTTGRRSLMKPKFTIHRDKRV